MLFVFLPYCSNYDQFHIAMKTGSYKWGLLFIQIKFDSLLFLHKIYTVPKDDPISCALVLNHQPKNTIVLPSKYNILPIYLDLIFY